jgi:hypothetical protein
MQQQACNKQKIKKCSFIETQATKQVLCNPSSSTTTLSISYPALTYQHTLQILFHALCKIYCLGCLQQKVKTASKLAFGLNISEFAHKMFLAHLLSINRPAITVSPGL